MFARLVSWWQSLIGSLWALPLAIAFACAGLALVALNLNLPWTSDVAWLYAGDAGQAPEFASSLVGAMITLTALAFSITMVVLTLAAQQLGPRLIGNFMSDRGTQCALGLFLGTIVYLLLVLRALDGEPSGDAPNLAITGGTALVLASTIALLFFVHWLAHSVVSDHVIARLGDALDGAIRRSFPENDPRFTCNAPKDGAPVALEKCGYVQVLDHEGLANSLSKLDAVMVLKYHPGDHVLFGESDASIVGANSDDGLHALKQAIVISAQRTPGQDPVWTVRQLVEIGLRALSPGINDEFTAIAAVNRLALSLSILLRRCDPAGVWCDDGGVPRVFGPTPTISDMADAAFDQLREASIGKAALMQCLTINLCKLQACAATRNQATVRRHMLRLREALARAPLSVASKRDLDQTLDKATASV